MMREEFVGVRDDQREVLRVEPVKIAEALFERIPVVTKIVRELQRGGQLLEKPILRPASLATCDAGRPAAQRLDFRCEIIHIAFWNRKKMSPAGKVFKVSECESLGAAHPVALCDASTEWERRCGSDRTYTTRCWCRNR